MSVARGHDRGRVDNEDRFRGAPTRRVRVVIRLASRPTAARSKARPLTTVILTRAAIDSANPIRASGKEVVARKNSSEKGMNIPVPMASIKKAPAIQQASMA
jgi:hypothetical protein